MPITVNDYISYKRKPRYFIVSVCVNFFPFIYLKFEASGKSPWNLSGK